MQQNELMHYGVLGMKWGKRKARPISGFQAKRNASRAAEEARKKSIEESRASGDKGIGSFQRANRKALNAKRKAYGESMAKDAAHNKQLKAEKKAAKVQAKVDKLQTKRDKYKKLMESEIDSFKGYEKGIFDKKGREILSAKDVEDCKRGLADTMNKNLSKMDAQIERAKRVMG